MRSVIAIFVSVSVWLAVTSSGAQAAASSADGLTCTSDLASIHAMASRLPVQGIAFMRDRCRLEAAQLRAGAATNKEKKMLARRASNSVFLLEIMMLAGSNPR